MINSPGTTFSNKLKPEDFRQRIDDEFKFFGWQYFLDREWAKISCFISSIKLFSKSVQLGHSKIMRLLPFCWDHLKFSVTISFLFGIMRYIISLGRVAVYTW